jgi:hypothetical protein
MVPTLWMPIGELLQNGHAVGLLSFLARGGRPSVVDATLPNDHRGDIPPPQRLATVADAFDSGRSGGDYECKRSSFLPEDDENRKPMDDWHLVVRGFGV